jgi:hypothetical protein
LEPVLLNVFDLTDLSEPVVGTDVEETTDVEPAQKVVTSNVVTEPANAFLFVMENIVDLTAVVAHAEPAKGMPSARVRTIHSQDNVTSTASCR